MSSHTKKKYKYASMIKKVNSMTTVCKLPKEHKKLKLWKNYRYKNKTKNRGEIKKFKTNGYNVQ